MLSWLSRCYMLAAVLVCLSFVANFSVYGLGQPRNNRPATLALNMLNFVESQRSRWGFHDRGVDIMSSPKILSNIGGVLSQGDELVDDSGIKVALQLDYDNTFQPGRVVVRETGPQASKVSYNYGIEYNDLVPMVLFVASGGTSLYTYWEEDDKLPAGFSSDAGFVAHPTKGMVALEFHGTRYAKALYHVDTCIFFLCTVSPDEDLYSIVDRINDSISTHGNLDSFRNLIYINTDVHLPFRVSMRDDRLFVDVDGEIARFYPDLVNGRIVIRTARKLFRTHQRAMGDVFFLFETLALLRSVKISARDDWSIFVEKFAASADTNTEPWNRYIDSFCSVYPDNQGCRN